MLPGQRLSSLAQLVLNICAAIFSASISGSEKVALVSKEQEPGVYNLTRTDAAGARLTDSCLRMSWRQQRKGGDIRYAQIRDAKDSSCRVGYSHGIIASAHFT